MTEIVGARLSREILLLRMNRPHRLNALTYGMLRDLFQHFDEAEADSDLRAIVLTGEGRSFSAGLDLKENEVTPGTENVGSSYAALLGQKVWWNQVVRRVNGSRLPVIAAVNGPAAGGGFALALACDIRIASRSATFIDSFVKLGLSGCELGLSWFLPRLVGMSHAADIMLTGRAVTAEEALAMGLVLNVVDDDELINIAIEKAEQIAKNSPMGIWLTKETMWSALQSPSLEVSLRQEMATQVLCLGTEDARSAFEAALSDRQPQFHNR
jgi:enoyl-CoA hydratase